MSLAAWLKRLNTSSATRTEIAAFVPGGEIDEARGLRTDGVVLDERAGPEVSPPHAAEDPAHAVDGRTGGHHCRDGAGYVIAGGIVIGEPCACETATSASTMATARGGG